MANSRDSVGEIVDVEFEPRPKTVRRSIGTAIKDGVFLFATPIVSLFYMALFPFIALVMLMRSRKTARTAG